MTLEARWPTFNESGDSYTSLARASIRIRFHHVLDAYALCPVVNSTIHIEISAYRYMSRASTLILKCTANSHIHVPILTPVDSWAYNPVEYI